MAAHRKLVFLIAAITKLIGDFVGARQMVTHGR